MDTQDLQNQTRAQLLLDEGIRQRAAAEFGLELGLADGNLNLTQRRSRQRGVAVVALIFAVGLLLVGALLPGSGFPADAVRASALAFGFCLLLLAAYLPFTVVDVEVSRRRIARVRRWWGIVLKRRIVAAEEMHDLSIDRGRSGSIGRSFDLVGRGEFGKLKLIDDIPDPEMLAALRRQIILAAGLRPSGTH